MEYTNYQHNKPNITKCHGPFQDILTAEDRKQAIRGVGSWLKKSKNIVYKAKGEKKWH
jgi:hypothetical protein